VFLPADPHRPAVRLTGKGIAKVVWNGKGKWKKVDQEILQSGGCPLMTPSMKKLGWGIGINNKVLFDRRLSLS
jgi:hypothetical protein